MNLFTGVALGSSTRGCEVGVRIPPAGLVLAAVLAGPAFASDVGYLHGRVETEDGEIYAGQLRWGTEESFWTDVFNATKVGNEYIDYLDRDEVDRLRWRDWSGWDFLPGSRERRFAHAFAVRFGDLRRIRVENDDDLVAEFRNGDTRTLSGGSNDVGARVTVVDPRRGRHELRWSRIRTIEFTDGPSKLPDKLGEPIYGTVKSGRFDFTGRIQWDHDECLTVDELDGDTRDGDMSIAFGDIRAIRKHRLGAMVTLTSGTEVYLTGSNDVNRENRGVVVVVPRLGNVKIGWDDFDEVTFGPAPDTGPGYAAFPETRPLTGTVVTRRGRHEGRIVFDLDESLDCELLHGMNRDTEYLIPFRDIARIRPRTGRFAEVELRMGLTIELDESQDVTRRNSGLLVFGAGPRPAYVPWRDVTEIVFR
jgi:hypothetical protein